MLRAGCGRLLPGRLRWHLDRAASAGRSGAVVERGFGPLDVTSPLSPGTAYAVIFELDQPAGRVRAWVNGRLAGELSGAGRVFQHHEDTGIGAINEDTYYHDGVRQGVARADFFAGDVEQILVYNRVLTSAEHDALWRLLRCVACVAR